MSINSKHIKKFTGKEILTHKCHTEIYFWKDFQAPEEASTVSSSQLALQNIHFNHFSLCYATFALMHPSPDPPQRL
jgi:hypothetical protein